MSLINECQFRAASGGLTDFIVASAITGFFMPADCTNPAVVDGALYHWRAESDDLSQHELFIGAYAVASTTVARTVILQSSNGGAKVNFSAAPRVRMVAVSQDLIKTSTTGNYAEHSAIGNYGDVHLAVGFPGDPANEFDPGAELYVPLLINDYVTGDLSTYYQVSSAVLWSDIKHTGTSGFFYGLDVQPTVNSDSNGALDQLYGVFGGATNFGSGDIGIIRALAYNAYHAGSGHVTRCSSQEFRSAVVGGGSCDLLYGENVRVDVQSGSSVTLAAPIIVETPTFTGGSTVTNLYGMLMEDHSGIGSVDSENIRSQGAGSLNNFEGFCKIGSGIAVASLPASGAGNIGHRYYVTDALSPVWGTAVAGGGARVVPVFSDGTNWIVG